MNRGLVGTVTPVLLAGMMYAAYQLTFFATWEDVASPAGLVRFAIFAFGGGTLYAYLHHHAQSVLIASICHLTATMAMRIASVYG